MWVQQAFSSLYPCVQMQNFVGAQLKRYAKNHFFCVVGFSSFSSLVTWKSELKTSQTKQKRHEAKTTTKPERTIVAGSESLWEWQASKENSQNAWILKLSNGRLEQFVTRHTFTQERKTEIKRERENLSNQIGMEKKPTKKRGRTNTTKNTLSSI